MNLRSAPRLASAMTPFPYSVDAGEKVEDALALMEAHGIRHVPVVEHGAVVGVVTDRDIKAAQRVLPELASYPVTTAYAGEPFVVDINQDLVEVLRAMSQRRLGSVVVTREGRLAGIFTYVDACRAFAELLEAHFREGEEPDDIIA